MTREATLDDLNKIIESIPKEDIREMIERNSFFAIYRRMLDQQINGKFTVYRPTPKTELLSPEGDVLMRDGELVEEDKPKIYVGIDFGWNMQNVK